MSKLTHYKDKKTFVWEPKCVKFLQTMNNSLSLIEGNPITYEFKDYSLIVKF